MKRYKVRRKAKRFKATTISINNAGEMAVGKKEDTYQGKIILSLLSILSEQKNSVVCDHFHIFRFYKVGAAQANILSPHCVLDHPPSFITTEE